MAAKVFSRPGIWVQVVRSPSGRGFNAWKPRISRFCNDRKSLLKWLAWPPKTATGDELRSWLDGLEGATEVPAEQDSGQGLDPSDPQYATRTVI